MMDVPMPTPEQVMAMDLEFAVSLQWGPWNHGIVPSGQEEQEDCWYIWEVIDQDIVPGPLAIIPAYMEQEPEVLLTRFIEMVRFVPAV